MDRVASSHKAIFFLGLAAFAAPAAAADGAATFQEVCAACHGKAGEGVAGLAPPLKGNAVAKSHDNVRAVIKDGRVGKAKKYPQIPQGMPAQPIYDDVLDAVVKYVVEDLQK